MNNIQRLRSERNRELDEERELRLEENKLKRDAMTPSEYEMLLNLLKGGRAILDHHCFFDEVDKINDILDRLAKGK